MKYTHPIAPNFRLVIEEGATAVIGGGAPHFGNGVTTGPSCILFSCDLCAPFGGTKFSDIGHRTRGRALVAGLLPRNHQHLHTV